MYFHILNEQSPTKSKVTYFLLLQYYSTYQVAARSCCIISIRFKISSWVVTLSSAIQYFRVYNIAFLYDQVHRNIHTRAMTRRKSLDLLKPNAGRNTLVERKKSVIIFKIYIHIKIELIWKVNSVENFLQQYWVDTVLCIPHKTIVTSDREHATLIYLWVVCMWYHICVKKRTSTATVCWHNALPLPIYILIASIL